uniref:Uncharacterized protein n=1 Tax=Aegilops tauschii subsp. strangulata TaxID=200361 RepID=A0A453B2J0_AEGTS
MGEIFSCYSICYRLFIRSTFEDAKSALEKVLRHEDLQEAPLLVFANKQDLPAAVREEELDRHLHLKEFDERPCMFVAGSAYDGWSFNDSV